MLNLQAMKAENKETTASSKLNTYKIALQVQHTIMDKILATREQFRLKFSLPVFDKLPIHIGLVTFEAMEPMESTLIRWFQQLCKDQQRFEVAVNNYGGTPTSSIYLRIQNVQPFMDIIKKLDGVNSYLQSCGCPAMQFELRPHIKITDKLSENIFPAAMSFYSQQFIAEKFYTNEIMLLKKGNNGEYKMIQLLPLNSFFEPSYKKVS